MKTVNDFVISIGTVNGSGSQSANNILVRTLFHMGIPVTGKNLFPSNIAGLPTWFSIRVSGKGQLSRHPVNNIVVGMNASTLTKDQNSVAPGGVFIYNTDLKVPLFKEREDVLVVGISFKSIVNEVTDSVKLKKLLTNVIYVGVLGKLLGFEKQILDETIEKIFNDKPQVIEVNKKAVDAGWTYANEKLNEINFPFSVEEKVDGNKGKVLIDGNTASALGLLFGGCSFLSWYPITPSSSVAEKFHEYCEKYRKTKDGKNNFAIVQAEDELAAISMVIGAGWTGARAVTPTSGPGLSLMAEASGLSYFAEVPAVIWDVQRAGPSTGLPTRTMQCDITSSYYLSHGDTQHIVLLPCSPSECFEFGKTCFDLAERLQTLVIVLSDLDLGMNFWICDNFKFNSEAFDRGKVVREKELNEIQDYARYRDTDGDGITYRTLPGTHHDSAAYFTRGTGHDDRALYSEDNENYRRLLDRLSSKLETAKNYIPKPIIKGTGSKGLIAFGSSNPAALEFLDGQAEFSYMRIRALPLTDDICSFIENKSVTYVVDQNRDGQMYHLILSRWPHLHDRLKSIRQYDGLPLAATYLHSTIENEVSL